MKKLKILSFVFFMIVFVFVICFGSNVVRAITTVAIPVVDQQLIKKVVNDYFDKKYQSLKNLQLGDFSSLIANSSTNDAIKKEMRKLDLEVYHNKVFQLQIQQYQIYLDFGNMTYDPVSLTATINVTEGSDVIYAVSAPTISKARNISHTIVLQKDNGIWKLSVDKYEDEFWKFLLGSKLTDADLRTQFESSAQQFSKSMATMRSASPNTLQQFGDRCPGGTVHGVSVCYDWIAAKNYADTYAINHNTNYYYYLGFDCTNFVSQAMYQGGGISQVFDDLAWQNRNYYQIINGYPQGYYDGNGFYYWKFSVYYNGDVYNLFNHSTSWTGVDELHTFLVPGPTNIHFHYLGGPIAKDLDPNDISEIRIGDIIQFDWDGDGYFDHSVIVSDIWDGVIIIDAHSDDYFQQPLSIYSYSNIRYIHISDYLQLINYIPFTSNSGPYPNIATQLSNQAYPAPLSNNPLSSPTKLTTPQPYPAP